MLQNKLLTFIREMFVFLELNYVELIFCQNATKYEYKTHISNRFPKCFYR